MTIIKQMFLKQALCGAFIIVFLLMSRSQVGVMAENVDIDIINEMNIKKEWFCVKSDNQIEEQPDIFQLNFSNVRNKRGIRTFLRNIGERTRNAFTNLRNTIQRRPRNMENSLGSIDASQYQNVQSQYIQNRMNRITNIIQEKETRSASVKRPASSPNLIISKKVKIQAVEISPTSLRPAIVRKRTSLNPLNLDEYKSPVKILKPTIIREKILAQTAKSVPINAVVSETASVLNFRRNNVAHQMAGGASSILENNQLQRRILLRENHPTQSSIFLRASASHIRAPFVRRRFPLITSTDELANLPDVPRPNGGMHLPLSGGLRRMPRKEEILEFNRRRNNFKILNIDRDYSTVD